MDPLDEKRNGYSLADCAEIMTQWTQLKTEHGEPGYKPHFQQYLRSKGLTEDGWAHVWNEWHQVTENDPALGAKFHMYMGQVRQRQMIAKQPNVSGESMEGVSLEAYAKISAQLQSGAAVEQLIAAEGITMEQWQAGQAAWGQRMGQSSPTDPIMLQYGQLYQKWSPNHQASMEAATEAFLEEATGGEGGAGLGRSLELDNADAFFDHADIRVRAKGVRQMILKWELASERTDEMRRLTQRAYDEGVKILNEGNAGQAGLMGLPQAPDAMDIHSWSAHLEQEQFEQGETSMVVSPIKDLANEKFMSPAQSEAAQAAYRAAIARHEPRAAKVGELFAQTTDELKRGQLRQLMDDYRETLSELGEALDDWDYRGPEGAAPAAAASPAVPTSTPSPSTSMSKPDTGLLAVLKSLPILGSILRMLGL